MRMRRKKNLDARLEQCSAYLINCETANRNYEESPDGSQIIDFEKIYGNSNRIMLEIGCGKGGFACEYAKRFPDVNVLAVEKTPNVIVTACEAAAAEGLTNILFMNCEAEYLERFIPKGSISEINLNFSCPYPKAKYAKHRLTHERFLKIYEKLMAPDAAIFQKTDNPRFFEFSVESFSKFGFEISNVSLDLHNSGFEGNIVTEYERIFSENGQPIYRLEARKPNRPRSF